MQVLEKIKEFADTDRIAVKCFDEELTYRQLDDYSDKVANYLLQEFKEDRKPIIIYGNKDNYIIPVMMGALKSGRAYVPIDITFPPARVKAVIEEVKPKVVFNFTDRELQLENAAEMNKEQLKEILNLNVSYEISQDNWVKDDDNCYILFTSGSTGNPKGVQINKRNIDSFTKWFEKYLDIDNSEDVILNQVSYSFDVSVIPIYIGLANGKTLFTLSKEMLDDFKVLMDQLYSSNIRYWVSTPALADICCKVDNFNNKFIKNIDKFVFAGEVLTKKLINDLMNRFPNVQIINGYGPTEATVLISATTISQEMMNSDEKIPIGTPIDSCTLNVVDEYGNNVEENEKGELVVIGDSVSKGYLNNPKASEKAFFKTKDNKQGYRTGDLVYYKNNILYYCGRKDFQIKLNGFRIEIEDIENNLRKVKNINNTVVLPVYNDEKKISHLTAFVVLEEKNDLSNLKNKTLIKNELKDLIPSYMIPRNIKILDEFPINTNGKIDRKKLMESLL